MSAAAQASPLDAGVEEAPRLMDGGSPSAPAALALEGMDGSVRAALPEGFVEVTVKRERSAGPGEFELHGTGSKQSVLLEELAASVAVVDRKALDERAVLDAQHALSLVPGLVPMWTYGGFQAVQSRGFQALVLLDGRRDVRSILSGSAPLTALFDLERIEVLRGPSALLYGYGAVGGTINMIRRRASSTPKHELALGLGLPGQYTAHVGSQGPIARKLSYRVDLGHVRVENFRAYESARSQGTTTLRYAPTSRHTLQLRLSYAFDRYSTDVGIPTIEDSTRPGRWSLPPGSRPQNRYSTANDGLEYRKVDAVLDYRYDLTSAVYLEARAAVTRDRYSYLAAESLTYVPPTQDAPAQVSRAYLGFAHAFRPVTVQLELHADVHTGPLLHKLVAGYQLDHVTGATDRFGLGGFTPAPVELTWPADHTEKVALKRSAIDHRRHVMHSLYALDHLKLREILVLNGGVRFDFIRSRTRRELLDVQSQDEMVDPATGARRPWNRTTDFAPTGQLGLVVMPSAPVTAYVSYANGYKPQFVAASATGVTRYDPELTQQLEGGLRLRLERAGHSVQVDAAGYLIRRKNLLVPRGVDERVPAGLAQSRGADLTLGYKAPAYVELTAGYSLTDAEYKDFIGPSALGEGNVDLSGNTLRLAPRHSATSWLRVLVTERLRVGVGGRYLSSQLADDEGRLTLPSYALLDANISYGAGIATFSLTASNLLDRTDYFASVIRSGSPNPQVTPGAGREILGVVRLEI